MSEWLKHKDMAWPITLFLLTVATRVPFMSERLYHLDSVQFALALDKYDVTVHQPHPPGYFMYIMFGRFFHLFIGDANLSLVTMNIIFSGLTVVGIYHLAKEIFDAKTGGIAAAVAITSPVFWFHGEVALSYAADAFFSTMLAVLCWKIYRGKAKYLWISAVVLGMAGGIRQNAMVFLFPFWLFSVRKMPPGKILLSVVLLGATCLSWFVPMVWVTGGWSAYRWAFRELWLTTVGPYTILEKGWPVVTYSRTLAIFTACGLGAGLFPLALSAYSFLRRAGAASLDRGKAAFLAAWILSPVCLYLAIYINRTNPGYSMIFLPGLFIVTAASVRHVCEMLGQVFGKNLVLPASFVLIILNTVFFFFGNSIVSYKAIQFHDRYLSALLARIRTFSPLDTVIVADAGAYYGFRDLMFYLPDYRVHQFDATVYPNGIVRRTLWGINRQTFCTNELLLPRNVRRFVSVFYAEDKFRAQGMGDVSISKVVPGLYLASGPVERLQSVFPEMKIRTTNEHAHAY